MARVVLARAARAALLELDWPLLSAVEEALLLLEREPFAGHELRGRLRGFRSGRFGAYRVIYRLGRDGRDGRGVRVVAVRHRSVAYGTDPR